ncbi:uncharacterized protein FOMMEDRAFT_160899 [Fomitiporia mediterranea MF3/22]|uniref:uncharacterized protein n=1 Tax=Fomitiporia mediterranea (strain MF3/22) TaxID=694068 RepID=UPI00044078EE|nr:uncharacterized protein FOMMEDRAFT_160899 [Fomitiporia mediterranea MF3/22]EJC99295.1 hypothetical protein FOMMEDRAFT_160899 [Fomitiporia mediterranea MF3/22]
MEEGPLLREHRWLNMSEACKTHDTATSNHQSTRRSSAAGGKDTFENRGGASEPKAVDPKPNSPLNMPECDGVISMLLKQYKDYEQVKQWYDTAVREQMKARRTKKSYDLRHVKEDLEKVKEKMSYFMFDSKRRDENFEWAKQRNQQMETMCVNLLQV